MIVIINNIIINNIVIIILSSSLLFPCTCHVLHSNMPRFFPIVFLTREHLKREQYIVSKYSIINLSPVKPRFTDTYTDASLLQTVFFIPGES